MVMSPRYQRESLPNEPLIYIYMITSLEGIGEVKGKIHKDF